MNLPILMYHKIQPGSNDDLIIDSLVFKQQMQYLKTKGYQAISLADLAAACRSDATFPHRPVIITFDDAYLSVLHEAKPILDTFKFSATVFVVPQAIGKHNFWDDDKKSAQTACMSISDIQSLANSKWEIGAHSYSHANMSELSDTELNVETHNARQTLEEMIGKTIQSFCYPYGAWNAKARAAVQAAGFTAACAISPRTSSVTADLYALRRIFIKPSDTFLDFKRKISNWYLIYRAWRKR